MSSKGKDDSRVGDCPKYLILRSPPQAGIPDVYFEHYSPHSEFNVLNYYGRMPLVGQRPSSVPVVSISYFSPAYIEITEDQLKKSKLIESFDWIRDDH